MEEVSHAAPNTLSAMDLIRGAQELSERFGDREIERAEVGVVEKSIPVDALPLFRWFSVARPPSKEAEG
jgi:hypothetical protein